MFLNISIAWISALGELKPLKLFAAGITTDDHCFVLCGEIGESVSHLLFRCQFSQRCYGDFFLCLGIKWFCDDSIHSCWKKWGRKRKAKHQKMVLFAILAALVYFIWKARNNAFWNIVFPVPLVKGVKSEVLWKNHGFE